MTGSPDDKRGGVGTSGGATTFGFRTVAVGERQGLVNQVFDAGAIWVKPDSAYKSLADLVAAAKKEPWSESANPAKRALGKIGSALWGLWDAIPA